MKNIIIFLFYYISRVTNDFWIKFAAVHIFSRQSEFPSFLQPHRFRLKQQKFVYIIFYIQGCLSNNQIALIFQLLAQRFQSISVFESSRVIPTLDGHICEFVLKQLTLENPGEGRVMLRDSCCNIW